jgi:SAM-dependent methyltransferase
MDIKEAALLRERVAEHWYYRSKARFVGRFLRDLQPRRILDIGAGSGFFTRWLLANGSAEEAWCVDPNYGYDSDAAEGCGTIHFRRAPQNTDADLVLLMDVLEHVDDDVQLLRDAMAQAAPHAAFLISVPAFQFLWSGHDVFLEHKRRYTLAQIEAVVHAAGLRVCEGNYFFAGVFPAAMLLRLPGKVLRRPLKAESDMRQHSRLMNSVLSGISRAELALVRRNRWFGLTACCLARRDPVPNDQRSRRRAK